MSNYHYFYPHLERPEPRPQPLPPGHTSHLCHVFSPGFRCHSRQLVFSFSFSSAGWEERIDKNGRIYFVDHNTRSTTFKDPRTDPNLISPPLANHLHESKTPQIITTNAPPSATVSALISPTNTMGRSDSTSRNRALSTG